MDSIFEPGTAAARTEPLKIEWVGREIPPEVERAFRYEGIAHLEGDIGKIDPFDETTVDVLDYQIGSLTRRVRIYDRYAELDAFGAPAIYRLDRLLRWFELHLNLAGENDLSPDGPPALSWEDAWPIYERRRDINVQIARTCLDNITQAEIVEVLIRYGMLRNPDEPEAEVAFAAAVEASIYEEAGLLDAYPEEVDGEERLVLNRMAASRPSLWEIEECVPGHGMILRDLRRGDEELVTRAVFDDEQSTMLAAGEVIFARVCAFDDMAMTTGPVYPLSGSQLRRVIRRSRAKDLSDESLTALCLQAAFATDTAAVPLQAPAPELGGKVPRNAPCPCGSGRKFKHCCGR